MIWIGGFGWGTGTTGLVITLVLFAVNATGLYLVIRHLRRVRRGEGWNQWPYEEPPSTYEHRSDALRILEERYARGEIDREEFLRRRQDLLGGW